MPDGGKEHGKSRRIAIALWCAVALWAAFIFFMSAHSGDDLSTGDDLIARVKQWLAAATAALFGPGVDVVSPAAHFAEYAVFGALLFGALQQSFPDRRSWRLAAVAVVIASLYGATDELHQYFVPDRACDPLDWLVDTCGSALGALLARAVLCHRSNRPIAKEGTKT